MNMAVSTSSNRTVTGADRASEAALSTANPPGTAVLLLPAYLALAVATGAGCHAVTQLIAASGFTFALEFSLALSLLVSYGSQCGGAKIQMGCQWVRWILATVLLPLTLYSYYQNSYISSVTTAAAEANTTVAVMMTGVTILSILIIGVRYAEERTIPLSAPLVPTLSLFGLLNVEVVDSAVSVTFLLFVAATLYLLSYERMVHQWLKRQGTHLWSRFHATIAAPHFSPPPIGRQAAQYLMASSAWFAVFVLGAIVLYQPLQMLLPRGFSTQLAQLRATANFTLLDWRGSSSTVELRGGHVPLSDRELMRVTVQEGSSPGLWRGRSYEQYSGSQWDDTLIEQSTRTVDIDRFRLSDLALSAPRISPEIATPHRVTATVQPLDFVSGAVYSPGFPVALRGNWHHVLVEPDGSIILTQSNRSKAPYVVQATVPDWRLSRLSSLPGPEATALRDPNYRALFGATLDIPEDRPELRPGLEAIARQVLAKARTTGKPVGTPYQKARAVSDYLAENYQYSLDAPPVPSDQDAVLYFLKESRQGACDMFASSMALLLRAMNVPARLVTGYLEPDPSLDSATPANDDSIILRERDAHAWVEFFVPRAGWVTYDPTQGTQLAPPNLNSRLAEIFRLPQWQAQWRVLLFPLVGLTLLIIGAIWSSFDMKKLHHRQKHTELDQSRARIKATYRKARQLLKRRVPCPPRLTPLEFEAALDSSALASAARQEFAALSYLFTSAHYGNDCPIVDEAELRACLRRLRQGLRLS